MESNRLASLVLPSVNKMGLRPCKVLKAGMHAQSPVYNE